jgi:hypothetical protein
MRRALLLAAALAIPVSGASVALVSGGQAWSGAKIVCTTVNGTITGNITISGCSGGNTGGSSNPIPTSSLSSGGTITWVSGSTTTISAATLVSTSAKKCPGYVKGGSSNPSADKVSGTVTADTGDGIKTPGKYKGAVCISSTGTITNVPGKTLSAS